MIGWGCGGVTVKVSERNLWPSVQDAVAPRGRLTFVPSELIVTWVLETVTQGRASCLGCGCTGSWSSAWATQGFTAPATHRWCGNQNNVTANFFFGLQTACEGSSSFPFAHPFMVGHSQSPASILTPPRPVHPAAHRPTSSFTTSINVLISLPPGALQSLFLLSTPPTHPVSLVNLMRSSLILYILLTLEWEPEEFNLCYLLPTTDHSIICKHHNP